MSALNAIHCSEIELAPLGDKRTPIRKQETSTQEQKIQATAQSALSNAGRLCMHASCLVGNALWEGTVYVAVRLEYLTKETLKVTLVAAGIFCAVTYIFPSSAMALTAILVAPVFEEIIFRGILLTSVHHFQKTINLCREDFWGHTLNAADHKSQEVFRVRLTAVIFGLAHAFNPHSSLALKALQISVATVGGLTYGYLKERKHSLVLPILGHSFSNAIAVGIGHIPDNWAFGGLAVFFANEFAWYKYATRPDNALPKAV